MLLSVMWRRLRGHYGINAARMTVTARLPWWERGAALFAMSAVMMGLLWWAFDTGQIFGSMVNRKEVGAQIGVAGFEAIRLREDDRGAATRNAQLESDLAIARAAQQALSRQVSELNAENAHLKDEASMLQRLVYGTGSETPPRSVRPPR